MYIIIVGCGTVGADLANKLASEGHDIVVVDRQADAFQRLGSSFNGATVTGTGIDEDVLRKAGIERADAVAAVTSFDTTNLMVAQIVRQLFHVERVVARVFDPDKESSYREFGVDTVCPVTVGVNQIRNAILANGMTRRMTVNGELEVVQVRVTNLNVAGRTVGDLNSSDFRCLSVTRNHSALLPNDDFELLEEDVLLAVVRVKALEAVKRELSLHVRGEIA
jgi:trk system potassium uptake protein TrkA